LAIVIPVSSVFGFAAQIFGLCGLSPSIPNSFHVLEQDLLPPAIDTWVPELVAAAVPCGTDAYIEFFTATIRNRNTRLVSIAVKS
jgi:hypothetical protein